MLAAHAEAPVAEHQLELPLPHKHELSDPHDPFGWCWICGISRDEFDPCPCWFCRRKEQVNMTEFEQAFVEEFDEVKERVEENLEEVWPRLKRSAVFWAVVAVFAFGLVFTIVKLF